MYEKLSLQWHDFRDHITDTFGKLLKDKNFSDVTLVCGNGNQIEGHKVVLAASSPFFESLLGRNAHPHPVIYMRGVKSDNLEAILDFVYCGEANILQENLEAFLLLAEELQIKGFLESTEESQPFGKLNFPMKPETKTEKPKITKFASASDESPTSVKPKIEVDVKPANAELFQEIDAKIKPFLVKDDLRRGFSCKVCGKHGDSGTVKDHIEAIHLEGISLPCNFCKTMLKSRSSLKMHKRRHHQNSTL